MLNAYALENGRLAATPVHRAEDLTRDVVWVDLINPTTREAQYLIDAFGQEIGDLEELVEIRASARVYRDEHGLHLNSYFLYDDAGIHRNVTVGFTVNRGRLFTLRTQDLEDFREFRYRARHEPYRLRDAVDILCGLFEYRAVKLTDALGNLQANLETLSRSIFSGEERDMARVLQRLAWIEDTNGKLRLSLLDNQRALSFLVRADSPEGFSVAHFRETLSDIESLLPHCGFLFEKTDFLMDSAMGAIDIEQNKIIKLFSVAAVMLMPPTLVASVYGMNFKHMPELEWVWGYPASIALMVCAAVVPFLVFKHKGWL